MARPPDPQRDDAIAAIRKLTSEHGVEEGVRLARKQFPDVPRGSWGRWRFEAVGYSADQEEIDRKAAAALEQDVRLQIPPPEVLTAGAETATVPATRKALDFWRMLDELDEDARLLREFAVTTGADGKRKVRVPFALRDAHRMRCDLIRLALQHSEVVWSTDRMRAYHEAITAEIVAVDPEIQKRILDRLRRRAPEFEQRGF